ncbi:MAG: HAD family hydrolase [Phycisphaerae bacterium]|nr:HAD family hydrolase [Phycisphaerae bacterium]
MTRSIKAILFDLGDTLLDFGKVDFPRMFREGADGAYDYLQKRGYSLPSRRWYGLFHRLAIHWNVLVSAISRREFNSLDVLERCCRRMGLYLSADEHMELCWKWYEPLCRHATVETGLAEMLTNLKADGLKLVIVSNTFVPGQILDRHLAMERLLEHLPDRIYSCNIGHRKPHPRIFHEALRLAGTTPEEVMFVGDTPKADILGASRLGMIPVLKDPTGAYRKSKYRPAHTIRSILELPQIIAEYKSCSAMSNDQ